MLAIVCLLAVPAQEPYAPTQVELAPWSPVPNIETKVGGEYVVWWIRRGYIPPVVTTGPAGSQGILGQPGTSIVYGDERLETRHNDRFIGGRFFIERVDRSAGIGGELRAFFLERDSTYRTIKPVTNLLALAYQDAAGQPASEVFAGEHPTRGLLSGGFVGYSRIELFGQEGNVIVPLTDGCGENRWKIDVLAGGRFLQMRDRYHHTATNRNVNPETGFESGAVLTGVIDNIRIANAFYGAQLGLRAEAAFGNWWVNGRVSGALGVDQQRYRAWGTRTFATPAQRTETPGGLFLTPQTSGEIQRTHFDAVGETAVNAGWKVTEHLEFFFGYTLLVWADPLRAGDQLQPRQGAGVPLKGDTLWAHGLNLGAQLRW
jgi:hypothetical protein